MTSPLRHLKRYAALLLMLPILASCSTRSPAIAERKGLAERPMPSWIEELVNAPKGSLPLARAGDVDADGEVTVADRTHAAQIAAGTPSTAPCAGLADITGNGVVDAEDLARYDFLLDPLNDPSVVDVAGPLAYDDACDWSNVLLLAPTSLRIGQVGQITLLPERGETTTNTIVNLLAGDVAIAATSERTFSLTPGAVGVVQLEIVAPTWRATLVIDQWDYDSNATSSQEQGHQDSDPNEPSEPGEPGGYAQQDAGPQDGGLTSDAGETRDSGLPDGPSQPDQGTGTCSHRNKGCAVFILNFDRNASFWQTIAMAVGSTNGGDWTHMHQAFDQAGHCTVFKNYPEFTEKPKPTVRTTTRLAGGHIMITDTVTIPPSAAEMTAWRNKTKATWNAVWNSWGQFRARVRQDIESALVYIQGHGSEATGVYCGIVGPGFDVIDAWDRSLNGQQYYDSARNHTCDASGVESSCYSGNGVKAWRNLNQGGNGSCDDRPENHPMHAGEEADAWLGSATCTTISRYTAGLPSLVYSLGTTHYAHQQHGPRVTFGDLFASGPHAYTNATSGYYDDGQGRAPWIPVCSRAHPAIP